MIKLVLATMAVAAVVAVAGANAAEKKPFTFAYEVEELSEESRFDKLTARLKVEARRYCDEPHYATGGRKIELECREDVYEQAIATLGDRAGHFQLAGARF
ncbi:MAG: UrcA family protein [Parvularculaceae bacterium]|nr:UrcA family protein [Parvularculaceae bacterium]